MTLSAPPSGSPPPRTGPYFEDFTVGQRMAVGPSDTGATGPDAAGGPAPDVTVGSALAPFLALVDGSGVLPPSAVGVLEAEWRDVAQASDSAALRAVLTVTSCRRLSGGSTGSVRWHAEVSDETGLLVQEADVTVLVAARTGDEEGGDDAARAFCTRRWGQQLAERLSQDERFGAATATWDGSIGLRSGTDEVQLRVYRGRVLEAVGRTPEGATFTVEAAEHAWTSLLTGPSNDYFRRAMSDSPFAVSGSAYEYLRMTKALMVLIDAARALSAEDAE